MEVTTTRSIVAACAAVVCLATLATAQPPRQSPQPPRQAPQAAGGSPDAAIQQAHERSATARTLSDYSEVIRLCQSAQRHPLSPNATAYVHQLLAWAHNRRGELHAEKAATVSTEGRTAESKKLDAQALAEFEAAIKLDANRWKAFHNRGVCYAALGKAQAAIADFSQVVRLNPQHANAWFNRAELHYDRREFDNAISDYTEAIRLKPTDVAAITARGHAYFQVAKYREALADYDRTVELAPGDAHALTNRADAATRLGQWQKAASDYREAVTLSPGLGRAYQGAAWLMATCPDESLRDDKAAIQAAKKAIELEGNDDAKVLDTLAAAYANAGQFEEARALVARAMELAPDTEVEPLNVRLAMYEKGEPYRLGRVKATPVGLKRTGR